MAMIAITTSSSIRVKANRRDDMVEIRHVDEERMGI
jgi:hypothetical protein